MSPVRSTQNGPHPLSQPPLTATNPLLSPLPLVPLVPPQVAGLRNSLHRRRYSFPPAEVSSGASANAFPWVMGGTPKPSAVGVVQQDGLSGFGLDVGGLTPIPGVWESLLNFDDAEPPSPGDSGSPRDPSTASSTKPSSVTPDESTTIFAPVPRVATPKSQFTEKNGPDMAWRTLLSRSLDVEGVGSVNVSRLFSEVWKRGGPVVVSNQCLWPNVMMSLCLTPGSPRRASHPSAEASLALQALYNIALRPSETLVFAGLLSSYVASTAPRAVDAFQDGQVYGPWTPTKGGVAEADLSQWTTLTPGSGSEWPSLATTLASGSGLTPRRPFSPALGLPPIGLSDPVEASPRPESRTGDGLGGIDEILAQIEDTNEMRENESKEPESLARPVWMQTSGANDDDNGDNGEAGDAIDSGPEPDTFDHARKTSVASISSTEPVDNMMGSMASSPFVSAVSLFSATSASTNIPTVPPPSDEVEEPVRTATEKSARPRHNPPKQLDLPTAPFIPPPPMCMFFSPAFRDLQQNKVGVWKGDLEVRGRGGGTFNVLIVGEQGSDHLWQSHTWGDSLSYPAGPVMTESCTATMIPVSTLAREGLLPVTMGMVLCNDANITDFVNMVQGLHAEGVAFHLPLPNLGLPIVFLPAKFDTADPLQRLGIAFMTKGGVAPIGLRPDPPSATAQPQQATESVSGPGPVRKRRRKSSSAIAKDTTMTSPTLVTHRRSVSTRRSRTTSNI